METNKIDQVFRYCYDKQTSDDGRSKIFGYQKLYNILIKIGSLISSLIAVATTILQAID